MIIATEIFCIFVLTKRHADVVEHKLVAKDVTFSLNVVANQSATEAWCHPS